MTATRGERVRRTRARWAGYTLLALGVLAICALDLRLKSSPSAGFLPESATWQIEVANLPMAWAHLRQLSAFQAFRDSAPGALQAPPLAIRKMTGVRPTPSRLRFWLGSHALLGGDGGEWCLSVRPGIALRVAALFGLPGVPATDPGLEVPARPDYATDWHEGFFLVASSRAYLDQVLAGDRALPRTPLESDVLALDWHGDDEGRAELRLEEGLPLSVSIPRASTPASPVVHEPASWAESLAWAACYGDEGLALAERAIAPLVHIGTVSAGLDSWRETAGAWWSAFCPAGAPVPGTAGWSVGVFAADFRDDVPVPELVFTDHGDATEPWPPEPGFPKQRHRWGDREGWLVPVPGGARAWAVADAGETRYVASHEHLMTAALGAGEQAREGAVASLHVQWAPFGRALASLVRRAAREELLPGLNEDDVSRDIAPVFTALQAWGTLEFRLDVSGDGLQGEGYLARVSRAP